LLSVLDSLQYENPPSVFYKKWLLWLDTEAAIFYENTEGGKNDKNPVLRFTAKQGFSFPTNITCHTDARHIPPSVPDRLLSQ
jgi:hypothetical protein